MKTFLFKRNYLFPLFLIILAFFVSCIRLPNVQGKGEVFMQGIWSQDSIANKAKLLNYTKHQFKFTCDSFYVELGTKSKVNYYEDSCFNNGNWREYAKGIYKVKNDTLFLIGDFTKSNYKQKVSGCYRNGRYITNFKIKSKTKTQLSLESLNDQRECLLQLKQPIICVQKEL